MKIARAAVLAAAGCSSQILAGDLPQDASVPMTCDAAGSCAAACSLCADGAAACAEPVFGACASQGTCELQAAVCGFSMTSRHPPDVACLGRRCGEPCTPGCARGDPACADAQAPFRCDRGGSCTGATPTCGHAGTSMTIE